MNKVTEVLKRQGVLLRKIADGTATDADRAEALKLQEALVAAAAAADPPPTATMTLAEFQKLAEADLAEIAKTPDEARLARLQRNLKSIRDQGKTAPDDVVTVEVAAKAAEPSILDALDAAVDAATKATNFDGRTRSGVREAPAAEAAPVAPTKDEEEKPAAKGDEPAPFDKASVSAQIAVEALDALTKKIADLRTAVASGAVDREAFEAAFSGWWDLRSAIETFTAIAAGASAAPPAEPEMAAATLSADSPAPAAGDPPKVEPTEGAAGATEGAPPVAKADWATLSPRLDAKAAYRELRRGAMRVAGHSRSTT